MNTESNIIKVNQHLKTVSQLNTQLSLKKYQIEHLSSLNQIIALNTYVPTRDNTFTHDVNISLTQLKTEAIMNSTTANKTTWVDKTSQCKISEHLRHILNKESDTQHNKLIHQLQMKKQQLENIIQTELQKQEPFMHEKIFSRMKRDALKKTKLATIAELQKIVTEKKNWYKSNKLKLQHQSVSKDIENLGVLNLQKMKAIMSKKITLIDWIYEYVNDEKAILKTKQKLKKIPTTLQQKIEQTLSTMNQQLIETQYEQQQTAIIPTDPLSDKELQQINSLRKQTHQVLRSPLQSENTQELMNRMKDLKRELAHIKNKK